MGTYESNPPAWLDRGLPVASGVYFFRLSTDRRMLESKAALLK